MRDWELFEDEVANLYKSLGFTVIHNINIAGQQIDLICEHSVLGIGPTKICVDCKHTRSDKMNSVTNQDVQNFISMFHSLRDKQGWSAGVLVSNRSFSQSAKAAAFQHHDIHLKTVQDLYEDLLGIRQYLHHSVHMAEDAARFADYISLNARLLNASLTRTAHLNTLQATFDAWLATDNSQQLCLLGDFGSGKTTFLRRCLYLLAKQYLSGDSSLIPLFIPLREYYDASSSDEIAERFFARECGARIRTEVFFKLLSSGRFLLLLDGFDEMGASSTLETRKSNYLKLARLISGGRKAVISCRPAYFPAGTELVSVFSEYSTRIGLNIPSSKKHPISRAAKRQIMALDPSESAPQLVSLFSNVKSIFESSMFLELQLFDRRQIARYLRQYDPIIRQQSVGRLDAASLGEIIDKTYDLKDLASRPILLKLIVSTIPCVPYGSGKYTISVENKKLSLSHITPSVLYHLYTENELRREEQERGASPRLIARKRKTQFICILAFSMYERGLLALEGDDFHEIVRQQLTSTGLDTEALASEIRTCSFLQRDHRDCVRFTHKSFLEYYAALYVCEQLRATKHARKLLKQNFLTEEALFFLGDLIGTLYAHLIPIIRATLSESKTPICTENCLAILNNARMPLPELSSITCGRIVYKKLEMKYLHVAKSCIKALRFESTSIEAVEFDSTEISSFDFSNGVLARLRIHNSSILSFDSKRGVVVRFSVDGSDLVLKKELVISVDELHALNTVWMFSDGNSDILPVTGHFENCIFYNVMLSDKWIKRAKFVNCIFILCSATNEYTGKSLAGCSGVILRHEEKEPKNMEENGEKSTIDRNQLQEWTITKASGISDRGKEFKGWHHALVNAFFGAGLQSGKDVRLRLKAVNTYTILFLWKDKEIYYLENETPKNARKVKLASCRLDEIEVVELRDGQVKKTKIPTSSLQVRYFDDNVPMISR